MRIGRRAALTSIKMLSVSATSVARMSASPESSSPLRSLLRQAPALLLTPLPLALLQPILNRIATHVASSRAGLFDRLGPHAGKRFLIDPVDLPFVLVLTPEREAPRLTAHRRHERPRHDAAIAGTFFNLLDMIDGTLDGDAMFFSRDLSITGDTEAVVALRNALDDFEGSALAAAIGSFGPFAGPASALLSGLRPSRGTRL